MKKMISKNPMKRHRCKEAWYDLGKAKSVKEQRCTEFDYRKRKPDFEFGTREQDYEELQISAHKKDQNITEETENETSLVEVHLTVQTSNQSADVPFVCVTSKLIGKAIIGYPVQIGELRSEIVPPPMKESVAHKLVWRISKRKRTPVCYVQDLKDTENYERENGVGMKEKPLVKNPGRTCVSVELIFSKIFAAIGQVQS